MEEEISRPWRDPRHAEGDCQQEGRSGIVGNPGRQCDWGLAEERRRAHVLGCANSPQMARSLGTTAKSAATRTAKQETGRAQ